MLNFDGRVALVTGAGRGIGREYALLLGARNARVVVNDIDPENAKAVVEEITAAGGEAIADVHNVVDEGSAMISETIGVFGRLDVVINNAAIQRVADFAEQDPVEWWRVFDTSLRATVEVSRAAWPHLVASGSGRLVNVASTAMLGAAGSSAYGAAKGAIWGLGNSLAKEGARSGLRVHTIMPTAWTPMHEDSGIGWAPEVAATFRNHFPAERVAPFVVWLVHPDTTAPTPETQAFRIGGGHARRVAFAVLPEVHPTADTPEGWAEVTEQILADAESTHVWSMEELLTLEFATVDPVLAPTNPGGSLRGGR